MEIIEGINNISDKSASVVTIGTFDGIHLGHLKILEQVLKIGKDSGLQSTLVTFKTHPKVVLNSQLDNSVKLLASYDEKFELLEKLGIEKVLVIDFTKEIANLSHQQFVERILIDKLDMQHLVIGHDHAFGKNRSGNFESLTELSKEINFQLSRVEPHFVEDKPASSSVVRNYLGLGKVRVASLYLGRHYTLTGKVVHGDGRGKKMSFPTANLDIGECRKIVPMNGVYAIDVLLKGKRLKGMMNIGFRPTFENRGHTMEAHIFGLNEDIYNETITVYFKKRLRKEKKFSSVEELIKQLNLDKEQSLLL
ncbi:MAG: bifunctional riboflavin kinase/FAD synthetase [Calditrichaeota bacterium]|nr:MAG: bifunctional riboflavin kinase/FAD synthetase [Calditrichota bacterium]MBL1203905.1 bifunctional riboflavin kinase/FAD synthetase [Calditrichota bacterium]NOG43738.1 bifunctional riboflavin kinase/FAD synthetase [Calditrichota bacterium]